MVKLILKLYDVAEIVGAREFAELYLITLFRFHLYFKDNKLDFSLVLPIFTWDACERAYAIYNRRELFWSAL